MIKADIVDRVVDLAQIPRAKAATAVETVIEAMRSALGAGDRIELRGFGVFQVKRRKRGIGRNPKTGVEVSIPPGNTIRFKPGKDLRRFDGNLPIRKPGHSDPEAEQAAHQQDPQSLTIFVHGGIIQNDVSARVE